MTETKLPGDQFVQSLARGLAVIRAFDADNISMTLSEVSKRTGLTRATARRFLHTRVDLGYVRTDGRVFELIDRGGVNERGNPQGRGRHHADRSRHAAERTGRGSVTGDDAATHDAVP